MTSYDVVTLGETMLRLAPPGMERLERARQLDIVIGGSESNTAVGLARLGLRTAWLSRLPESPLGRGVANEIGRWGVDTSHVRYAPDERLGLYFVEFGPPPRGTRVTYDRAGSAAAYMTPDDLPAGLFRPDGARLLHLTGITPALSDSAAATAARVRDLAKEAGWLFSFDVNYRGKLWTSEAARAGCEPFMTAADVLFVPRGDAATVYGLDGDPESTLETLGARYPAAVIVMTLGAEGGIARTPDGALHRQDAFAAEEVDRFGGGDAFSAGFLYGYLTLTGADRVPGALRWGAAVAALKYTIPGDMPLIEYDEAAALAAGEGAARLQR